jgi:hypothetical protein
VSVGIRLTAGVIQPEDSWELSHGSLRRILLEQPTAFMGNTAYSSCENAVQAEAVGFPPPRCCKGCFSHCLKQKKSIQFYGAA